MAQLAFEAAKAGAKALLCGPKSGLSGQQLPAGEGGGGQRGLERWKGEVWNVPINDGSEDILFVWMFVAIP